MLPSLPFRSNLAFAAHVALLCGVCLLLGCGEGAARDEGTCLEPCPCTEAGCPTGLCGLRVTLGVSCSGPEPAVELFFGECLEAVDLTPGEPRVACGFVPAGGTARVVARGDSIQWGPFELSCPGDGGELYPVALDCPP